jgi:septum formation protein
VHAFVYLASQSPRRRQLLDQLGVRHELLLPADDEDAESLEAVLPGERPDAYVQRVTQAKLHAARLRLKARGLPAAPILCADTTVALGRRILGKPADKAEARAMLGDLSGRLHKVYTAVAIGTARKTGLLLSTSHVRFAVVPAQEIARYAASAEPMGKAGAYAVQGRAAAWIEHMAGSYSGIMGLPLHETARLLKAHNISMDAPLG